MEEKTYAVMGATGRVGRFLAERLLKNGHMVRVLGRNRMKLSLLEHRGAKALSASFDDAKALTAVFRGADGVFVMIPPSYGESDFFAYQDRVGKAVCDALVSSGVQYALSLSSLGAGHPSGTGPIAGLHRMEQRLNQLPHVNALHLRASPFMENQYGSIPAIRGRGANVSTSPGNVPLPWVAARDIGEKAAEFLEKLSFEEHGVFELAGPKEYTLTEVTEALGTAIGKPGLEYVQVPYETAKKAISGNGMKPATVDLMMEMYRAGNEGKIRPTQVLTGDHRGKTTIEEFAKEFAVVYGPGLPVTAGKRPVRA